MKRTNEIKIRLTDDELAVLNSKVKQTSLSRESFCRTLFNNAKIKPAPQADIQKLIFELRKIGTNINSVIARAHTYKYVDKDRLVEEVVKLHEIEKLIIDAYSNKEV